MPNSERPVLTDRLLTPEERELVELYMSGITKAEALSKELGISAATIGIKLRRDVVKNEIRRLSDIDFMYMLEVKALQKEIYVIYQQLVTVVEDDRSSASAKVSASREMMKIVEKYAKDYNVDIGQFIDIPKKKYEMMNRSWDATEEVRERITAGESIVDILGLEVSGSRDKPDA